MTRLTLLTVTALTVLLSGCFLPAPGYRPLTHAEGVPGVVVRITGGDFRGTGAVVGPNMVATVEHVMNDIGRDAMKIHGRKARVVRVMSQPGNFEAIVLLEVNWDWDADQTFRLRDGAPASDGYVVWTRRGPTALTPSFVQRGDSGSPVLDDEGFLVGHLSAVTAYGAFSQIGIGSYYPSGAQLRQIEVPR